MVGNSTADRQGHCKMATLVKIGLLYAFIGTVLFENGNASVAIHHQGEDLRTMMFQQSEKTDYFGVTERVTPVVYRIPKNSSEPAKEIPPHTTHRLPKIVDFVLRRQKRSLRMRLHRMGDVIGSHTRVEWTTEGGEVMESRVLSAKCEYHGKVDGMENSLATIDLCNDMKGVIRTDDEDIYLQPILQSSTDRHGDHGTHKGTHTGRANDDTHIIRVHRRRANHARHSPRGGAVIDLTRDTSQRDEDVSRRMDGSKEWVKTRAKRQALHRGPRYMQVLLVTDGSLVRFHGRDLIEQYLLTQMSIVDNIYHHPSLGFEINLIVVKIKILDDSLVRRVVSKGDGKTSLDHFCHWANEEKPKNKNKDEDFDVAVYITKEEIGPAGYAPVTGMCNPIRSCALVKDDGTSSAFVIAHEIGHIFGMIHDGHGNDCSDDPSDGKIMASMVQSNYHTYYWSPCNKVAMEKYLVDVHCLDDKPKDPSWPVYSQPFGQSWSLDEQCRQEFGSGFSLCRAFDHLDPCYHLWCSHSSNQTLCKTKRGPPLPGTSCGRGKWCMNGSCLEKRTVLVDGGWSAWQKWEACSRTCGVGIQFRVRSCTQPRPKHGGRDCRGDREEFRTCNIQACSQFSDIREEQCTEFNVKRFDQGRRHNWLPMDNTNATEMCKMTCVSMETGAMFVSESNAIDGTFCSYDQPHHVCVKGTCHPVGCDGVLNSRQRDDQCGQCGGSGSTCKRVTGVYTEPLSKMEYHRILVVPAKARNIAIRELHSTHHLAHFIAVRDTATERWYLNGNTQQGPSKQFVAHGTGFTYSTKQREGESLTAKGPLLAPVDIMIYSMSTKLPPSLHYEYTIPPEVTQRTSKTIAPTGVEAELSRYVWAVSGWTNCSKPCGSGGQFEVFTCVDTEKRQYSDGFCSYLSKPKEARKECNTHPCGLYTFWWDAEDWSNVLTCSASCGIYGVQHRRVQCVTDNRGQIKAVEPAYCDQRALPIYTQPCNRFPCTTPEAPPTIPWVSTTTEGTTRTGSAWSPTMVTTPETTILQRVTSQGHRSSESVAATLSTGFTRSSNSGSTRYGSTQHFRNTPSTEKPRGDSTTESNVQSSLRSRHTTTTFLQVLTSATPPEVHGNVISAISRVSLEGQNRLEQVPVRNGPSTDRRQAGESTRSTTFKNEASRFETVPSSTVRRYSLEEDELILFNRNLEGWTTPRIRTPHAPSFESEDFDDFSSSSESEIELELFVDQPTNRNGDQERNIPRSWTTSAFEVSPPFQQPVDPSVNIRMNRTDRRRLKLGGGKNDGEEHERLLRNYENEKDVYGKEAILTNSSMAETVRRPASISRTSTSPTAARTSTTTTTTTTTTRPPASTTLTPNAAAKPSIITKSTSPIPCTSTTTTKAPNRNAFSPTPTTTTAAAANHGIPRSNIANGKASTSVLRSTTEASIPTNPPSVPSRLQQEKTTGSATSSIYAVRPMKAKTTVRKHQQRKFSNFHDVQPVAATKTIRDEEEEGGVVRPRLKMIAVDSIHRSFPTTTTTTEPPHPSSDCSSDRSILFCQAGANKDRCSKPTFYSLCCVSCRAYFSSL